MNRKYVTLDNYSQNTLTREDRQDITVSKCLGGVFAVGVNGNQPLQEDFNSQEQYGSFSLRAAVRPPYNQCWGSTEGTCDNKTYPGVR